MSGRIRLAVFFLTAVAVVSVGSAALADGPEDSTGVVDQTTGLWYLRNPFTGDTTSFYYGNPGDFPIVGDWDCDGDETPGLYRQSDGFVYLRNSNTQGIADIKFFFGNPGDIPLAGDFNNDGCDTISIFRPSQARVFIINELGENNGGLGAAEFDYLFGNPGDKPFVGDFDRDGVDTIGLHRESTGLVYFRNAHTQGNADSQFIFGNPGDKIIAAEWAQKDDFGPDTVGIFRPSNGTFYLRFSNTQGNADAQFPYGNSNMLPVAGDFGSLPGGDLRPLPNRVTFGPGTWIVGTDIPAGTYRSAQSVNGCYWARLSGFGGGLADIIANQFTFAHQIVTIKNSDVGFESSNCGTWTNQITPWKAPTAAFGDGTWIVSTEVAPGTWRNSNSADGCYWERRSGSSGELVDIIQNEFTFSPTVVTIASSDTGFFTEGCATWTYLGP
jgi:hypothetical protein